MKKHYRDPDSKWFKVIDLDTGEPIPRCRWANDETGEYGQLDVDENGNLKTTDDIYGDVIEITKHGNIKLVDTRGEQNG